MQVSLKPFGVEHAVNPKHVTSIVPAKRKNYGPGMPEFTAYVKLWVVGQAGYGTYAINLDGTTVEDVRRHLNREERKWEKSVNGE
jgi:hypothetical protein